MRLSFVRESLILLEKEIVRKAILERREIIRWHRDQVGDERCWLDDYRLWIMLEDTPLPPTSVPNDAMAQCRKFFFFRNAPQEALPPDAILDSRLWNIDLHAMTIEQLVDTLHALQLAIRFHRDIKGRPRTFRDDNQLYKLLPEKIPANFQLPSEAEFIGEARAPKAGCPSFWRSHAACTVPHDLHHWGPCS